MVVKLKTLYSTWHPVRPLDHTFPWHIHISAVLQSCIYSASARNDFIVSTKTGLTDQASSGGIISL